MAGVVIGIFLGLYPAVFIHNLVKHFIFTRIRSRERNNLQKYFGRYWEKDRDEQWNELKIRIIAEQEISGKVVTQDYGATYIDAGLGFPLFLNRWGSKNDHVH